MKNILLIGLGRFGRHIALQLNKLGHEGDITETESSIELNLYALKMKRTVKRTKKG